MLASMYSHRNCPSLLMEITNDIATWENCVPVLFIKLNIYLPYDQAVPLLGFTNMNLKLYTETYM